MPKPDDARSAAYEDEYRVRVWTTAARYHREHGNPTASKLAADVADAIRFYLIHLDSPGFAKEVYIEVRHHPKHGDDDERVEQTAFKLADVDYARPLGAVADCLRDFANDLDKKQASL